MLLLVLEECGLFVVCELETFGYLVSNILTLCFW